MEVHNSYDLIEETLKGFTRSKIRTIVMLCLKNGEKKVGDLEYEMNTRASSILHVIKDMRKAKLINKSADNYKLTNIGRIQALLLDDLIQAIITINTHEEFWLSHDLSGIPDELQRKIWMLCQSEIITGDPVAPLKSLDYFIETLINSKIISGVSPIVAPGFSEVITASVEKGTKVDLILTNSVFDIIYKENYDLLNALLKYENFRLYRISMDVKVAFTVTESFLNMGLFRLNGSYDIENDLVCFGEKSILWGMELFNYYKNMSYLIK